MEFTSPTTRAPARHWWGTSTPKETGGTPERPSRMWGECGERRSGGRTGPAPVRGVWEGGRFPMSGGTSKDPLIWGSKDQGGTRIVFPLPNRPWEACRAPGPNPCPPGPPLGYIGLSNIGGMGRRREAKEEGPSGIRGSGGTHLVFPPPTQALWASWGPGPGPPTSKARGTPGPLLLC